jgi:hypothetical protein
MGRSKSGRSKQELVWLRIARRRRHSGASSGYRKQEEVRLLQLLVQIAVSLSIEKLLEVEGMGSDHKSPIFQDEIWVGEYPSQLLNHAIARLAVTNSKARDDIATIYRKNLNIIFQTMTRDIKLKVKQGSSSGS